LDQEYDFSQPFLCLQEVFKKTKKMKSNDSPLGAALSASNVPAAKKKEQAKFKRLKPKRLILESANEDDSDDYDLFSDRRQKAFWFSYLIVE
jgi:hypothetical protein